MAISFPFQEIPSQLFVMLYRPVATVNFQHKTTKLWIPVRMIIDTGADCTILPKSFARSLGINLAKDCARYHASGIGERENVFLYDDQIVRLGKYVRKIPISFLDRDEGPALLGRQAFFETFRVLFENHATTFESPRARRRAAH